MLVNPYKAFICKRFIIYCVRMTFLSLFLDDVCVCCVHVHMRVGFAVGLINPSFMHQLVTAYLSLASIASEQTHTLVSLRG